jgi:dienelactone hydrolase
MPEPDLTFTVQPYLRARFDDVGQRLRFRGTSVDEAEAWRGIARDVLADLIGLPTMTPCDLNPQVTETVDCGDHLRERIELEVEPQVFMPVYILIPKGEAPFPVILNPHGHGGGGKAAVAGVTDDPVVAEAIAPYNYDYGVSYVRAGFICLCPDARGFGERREVLSNNGPLDSSCQFINHMALPMGQTVTGMWVWDLIRLIDYAETRPDCETTRLGCAGLSGGGLQTLWLTALEPRVQAAVVSGYCYGVKQSLLDLYGNCSCNYVPHLWEFADHGDLAGLIAPRPLMIQTGDEDTLNGADGMDNVYPQVALARRLYEVFDASDALTHDIFHGPHRWDNANSVPFMQEHV